jgi:hypothetical protein
LDSKPDVNPPGVSIPVSRPWYERKYAEDYERVFCMIRRNREAGSPTRLKQAVEYVYGSDYSSTEYQRVRRFINSTEYLKTESAGNFVQVEPAIEVFGSPLESDVSNTQKRNTEADSQKGVKKPYPKDRARGLLSKIREINGRESADHRYEIMRELSTYRDNIAGTYSILEHRVREQYLAIKNTTRFTDKVDAKKSQTRFREALETSGVEYSEASVLTLTIDPKRFGSHKDATGAIREAKGRLLSYLAYQIGESVTQVTISDFQRNGMLHYHIVLFGISRVRESDNETGEPTISEAQIREYWDEKQDIGSQVAINRAWTRGEEWVLHRDGKTVSLGYYLGKRVRRLVELAGLDTDSVPGKYWRQALFWVYNIRHVTCSDSLKETTEDNAGLPEIVEWEYVGTARYEQIPSYIRANMIVCGTP